MLLNGADFSKMHFLNSKWNIMQNHALIASFECLSTSYCILLRNEKKKKKKKTVGLLKIVVELHFIVTKCSQKNN